MKFLLLFAAALCGLLSSFAQCSPSASSQFALAYLVNSKPAIGSFKSEQNGDSTFNIDASKMPEFSSGDAIKYKKGVTSIVIGKSFNSEEAAEKAMQEMIAGAKSYIFSLLPRTDGKVPEGKGVVKSVLLNARTADYTIATAWEIILKPNAEPSKRYRLVALYDRHPL